MVMKTNRNDAGAALLVNLLSFWKKLNNPAVLHSMASCKMVKHIKCESSLGWMTLAENRPCLNSWM